MTYSSGGLIQATDYNGFVSTTSGANLNDIWGTGSGDKGWGQTPLATVSTAGTVTATQWASLVNTLSSAGSQTNTTLTSRTAPTAGQTISVLSNINTDLTSVTTNRGNAVAINNPASTWTGSVSKTTTTGTGNNAWTILWTHTITFPSADAARYFWNAGGLLNITMSKTSTGFDSDADWNTFINDGCYQFIMAGRVNGANQTIAGGTFTGWQRTGGATTGTVVSISSTAGWYAITPGGLNTSIVKVTDSNSPYTGNYVEIFVSKNAGATALTFQTYWVSAARTGAGQNTQISGGTATTTYPTYGTAPTVLVTWRLPATTYLTNSWGTPTVTASVA